VRRGTLDFQFANYAYEWPVKEFVLNHYRDYDVFFDIGANIGTYSIMLAKKGLKGYAFEPVKANFDAFHINLILNQLEDQITIYNVALGAQSEHATFSFDRINTGASHLLGIELEDEKHPLKAELVDSDIVPLDDFLPQLKLSISDRIFIKIDVEGMEAEVLKGAKRFLQTFPNIIIVMESVHSGKDKLTRILNEIAPFEILDVDELNMGARKILPPKS
jgi:FkbM family methyltransferase